MSADRTPPLFVVFEGLDGAGKTTCAMALSAMIGADFLTTPAPEIRECRSRILGSFGGSQEAAQLFYLSTVFAASGQVEAALAAGRSVVMDRYFLSTQAYAAFRGSQLELDMIGNQLVPAHLTVYLDAPLAVRKRRLGQRGCTAEDNETLNPGADHRLRELHRQKASLPITGRWMEIDNEGTDPHPVLENIIASLEALSGVRP